MNNNPVNSLSHEVRNGLSQALKAALGDNWQNIAGSPPWGSTVTWL